MSDEAGKLIRARKAAELSDFMKGFVRSGKVRSDVAIEALKEVLIVELERHGTRVRRSRARRLKD